MSTYPQANSSSYAASHVDASQTAASSKSAKENTATTPSAVLMHTSLFVRDLSRSVSFYTTFFGQEPTKVEADYAKFELSEPGLVFSLLEKPERVSPAFGHLGFRVASPEALQARLSAARTAKLPIREEMGTSCCYSVQDKFWVSDPDGFQWEVYQFRGDLTFEDPHAADKTQQSTPGTQNPVGQQAKGNMAVSAETKPSGNTPSVSGCC